MDDFRVGSVPSSEPYGDRHPYGPIGRKRQRHHHDQDGREQDDADTFEAASGDGPSATEGGEIEDYYQPSGSSGDDK
jgi:hypothetical protein